MSGRLQHRGGLACMLDRIEPDPKTFERLGGQKTVDRIIDALYDRIEQDEELRRFFRRDLTDERANQKSFFARWFGAPVIYDGYRGVRVRHKHKVTAEGAQRWLRHYKESLAEAGVAAKLAGQIMRVLAPIGMALVDDKPMLQCESWYRKPAADVNKGDLARLREWIGEHEELLEPGPAQLLMHVAARRGHLPIVRFLVKAGVDVNLPNCTKTEVAVTPYCIARSSKHDAVADYLLKQGAVVDIFTLAWLGDVTGAKEELAHDPSLVNAVDPAQDFLDVTPLDHAVERGKLPMVRFLLESGAHLGKGEHYLERAVDKKRVPLVQLLLEHGVSASGIGAGRWILHEKLAPLLHEHGADVTQDPDDWIEFCTGHHGNPEDPDLIREFLDLGVDVHARAHKGRTALHCATRVGYTRVIELLVERGADIHAQDDAGDTPLHYVFQSRPSADPVATARVLLDLGADATVANHEGATPAQLAAGARRVGAKKLRELLGAS